MHKFPIRIISAGAGSGKTHRLTGELSSLIGTDQVRPEAVVATSFTRKAATELVERLRQELFREGHDRESNRLATSFIGTVNSVCGSLLGYLAFQAGISTQIEVVVEEDQQVLFNQAISSVLDQDRVATLDAIARRFGFDADKRDWRGDLKNIIDAARSNGLSPLALRESSSKSLEQLLALLQSPASRSADELNRALGKEVETAIRDIRGGDDATKATANYLDLLESVRQQLRHGESIPWAQWAKLAKGKPAKKSIDIAERVREVAALHPAHPGLHSDLATFVKTLFALAAEAMEHYQEYKKKRGLMDFVDQESLLLQILDKSEVRERLLDAVEVLLVDEFQDTSPIQLALFLKLGQIARQSIWVGDPKQSIYAFRGADPALMDAVVTTLGGMKEGDIQKTSYRSRSDLVRFVNALFVPALADLLPAEQVELKPHRPEPDGAAAALRGWVLEGSNKELRAGQLADGIAGLIAEAPVIHDKTLGRDRPARPGDIAVLCRTKVDCAEMANALGARGISVAIGRPGLLQTPEGKLALACLRLMLNDRDTLAVAEIKVLTDPNPNPEVWLQERLDHLEKGQPSHQWCREHPVVCQVLAVARGAVSFSPSEALDELIEMVDMRRLLRGWGEEHRRLGNLERLRCLVRDYEESCRRQASAASIGGYLLWLEGLAAVGKDGQVEGNGPDAVTVVTCHSSKGLEWPIVVAYNLDRSPRERIWGLSVMDERDTIDLSSPLADRWLRYWPWPYGKQKKDTGLQESLDGTPEQEAAQQAVEAEELRLLYVTLTRARDYLVLCLNQKGSAWLELALDKARLTLPLPEQSGTIQLPWKTEKPLILQVGYPQPIQTAPIKPQAVAWVKPREGLGDFPPAKLIPSKMGLPQGVEATAFEPIVIGERVGINDKPVMDVLGTALHGFIAADRGGALPCEERLSLLNAIIARHRLSGMIDQDGVLRNVDALYGFLRKRYNVLQIMTEWPVQMKVAQQCVVGTVDMIVETTEGWVIIDHKSFPGPMKEWQQESVIYGGQLKTYAETLEKATGKAVMDCFIHFMVGGGVVPVTFKNI
jgi:ATP-dependent helicase/nuclease subunit A